MRKSIMGCSLALILAVFSLAYAQDVADIKAIAQIKDEGRTHSEVMEILSYLADVYGPRLAGSPTKRLAEEWVRQKLNAWGLENVHTEQYKFGRSWELKKFSAHMLEPVYSPLIAFPKAWTPGTDGVIRAEAIRVDLNSEADIERYRGKLRGRFVLAQPPREVAAHFTPLGHRYSDEELADLSQIPDPAKARRPEQRDRRPPIPAPQLLKKIADFYVNERVAAVLEPGRGDGGTIFVSSGGDRAIDAPAVAPQVVVAVEHYNRICRILDKKIKVELEMEIQAHYLTQDLFDNNVIGELPGTDKRDEIVMLGGHLDSWHAGTGATDDAAGCAIAMEAVRILQSTGLKVRRTVRIALWGGEEEGLLGSQAYVSEHFGSRPVPPPGMDREGDTYRKWLEKTAQQPPKLGPEYSKLSAYWNLDNGAGKIRGIYLQGVEEVRPIFGAWLAPFADMGAATLSSRSTGSTDHLSFANIGLPGFQFIQDAIEYGTRTHHSNMDVYDRIQKEDMTQAAVIMASFVYHTAMREEELPRKPLPPAPAANGR